MAGRKDPARRGMKIAEFERATSVPRSTIHHYLNLGLLPPPVTRGPRLHLYGEEHQERVREIGRLREQGLSLKTIAARMARRSVRSPSAAAAPEKATERATRAKSEPSSKGGALRDAILDAAVPLFMEQGYDNLHMSHVARAVGIGKATLYLHFGSKADLFMNCLDRLAEAAESLDIHSLLLDTASQRSTDELRAAAFVARFDSYRMMVSALASAAYGKDEAIAARARSAFRRIALSVEPWVRQSIEEGRIRPMDTELLAYMIWGALMAVGARMALADGRYTLDEALGIYFDFMINGTALRA
jgi:AcrR family transcriptional regulator